jgi:hypothetical protein
VDRATRPRTAEICHDPTLIEHLRDLTLEEAVFDEGAIDIANDFYLRERTRDEDDAISLNTLLFTARELTLPCAGMID